MKSGCYASVYWYGVPSLNRNREMLQEIVSWTRFPCLQPDPSTQIPYQGHRLGAQHSHGLDCKWRKEMAGWKATIFILFSLLCCGSHSPWCWGSISSIGWCEGVWASRVPWFLFGSCSTLRSWKYMPSFIIYILVYVCFIIFQFS